MAYYNYDCPKCDFSIRRRKNSHRKDCPRCGTKTRKRYTYKLS